MSCVRKRAAVSAFAQVLQIFVAFRAVIAFARGRNVTVIMILMHDRQRLRSIHNRASGAPRVKEKPIVPPGPANRERRKLAEPALFMGQEIIASRRRVERSA